MGFLTNLAQSPRESEQKVWQGKSSQQLVLAPELEFGPPPMLALALHLLPLILQLVLGLALLLLPVL